MMGCRDSGSPHLLHMNSTKPNRLLNAIRLPLYLTLMLWAIHLVKFALGLDALARLGVFPRHVDGLWGILFSPLLHSDWGHLLSNTPPLLMLGAIIFFFYRRIALPAFFMIYFLTGLAVWIFGRPVFHIGASGVIYGLVAFVFWNGIFRRNLKSIVLALIVVFYYGSMFAGILPGQEGISWESHLLGGLVGIFVSFWYRDDLEDDEHRELPSWEREEPQAPRYFLDRDTFEKTRAERQREQQDNDDLSGWFSSRTW